MRNTRALLFASILVFALSACSGDTATPTQPAGQPGSTSTLSPISVDYDHQDLDATTSPDTATITLLGDSITVAGSGATVDGQRITITSGGSYSISGALNDGQIVVSARDEETVRLVLNGTDITCLTGAPIYVVNAEKTILTLADGSDNTVTDGRSSTLDTGPDEPDAAIFSRDDLTINGTGSLTVHARYRHGILSKDDLKITSGSITVDAVNDGVRGRNSVAIRDGIITVNAGADGIQSNNDEDAEEGIVVIEGGTLNITAGMDGVQAATRVAISGGTTTISSGGGSSNAPDPHDAWDMRADPDVGSSGDSAKGIKAGVDVTITGGAIHVDAADDAIHSNASITIDGGELLLATGDDGVHSDSTLVINGGELELAQSYEGLESAEITINNGTLHIVSSDDGINAVSGSDRFSPGGPAGPGDFGLAGDNHLYVNGGYVVIDAMGDGLDVNGPIEMSGGVVIINGPTSNGNGAMDYAGSFTITGGLLMAAGSSGMAQAPSASSTQYSVMQIFPSPQAAGTLVHIEAQDGETILTFMPTKDYQALVLSSPALEDGSTYTVYTGGSSTGTPTDGLYAGGTYTPGTQVASLTITGMVTGAGPYGGGFPGAPGGGVPRPGGGRR